MKDRNGNSEGWRVLGRFLSRQRVGAQGKRPGLVVQCDPLNDSRLNTVIVIAITSTERLGELPGNVTLRKGEANLAKKSVVNVTQIKTVDKLSLTEKIGALSRARMDEVHAGVKLVMDLP